MTTEDENQRAAIAQEAANWLVTNRDEHDPSQKAAFVAWLRANPAHARAYSEALRTNSMLYLARPPVPPVEALVAQARAEPKEVVEEPQVQPRVEPAKVSNIGDARPALRAASHSPSRRRWLYAAAAAVVPVVILPTLWMRTHHAEPPVAREEPGERFATGHGQQLVQVLKDGSALHLNTDTAVTVRYQASSRGVEIEHGQVVFTVTHDPARPFRVTAGSAQVTAVGTRFDVYLQSEATVVTVVEGKVAVAAVANNSRAPLLVAAGEQVRVVRGEVPAEPTVVDASRSTAWLNRQISFRHEPLSQVVAEFNRYTAKPIQIDSPALGDLPVSGVFNVDDTESMIAFLRSLAGVKVEVTPSAIRVSGG